MLETQKIMVKWRNGIRGYGDPGEPLGICTMTFTNPLTHTQNFLTKSYERPSPGAKEVCSAKSISHN